MEDKCKRVAVFISYEDIERSSSIMYFIRSLSEEGYTVDIFSLILHKEISYHESKNINAYSYRDLEREGKSKIAKQICNFNLIRYPLLKLYRSVKLHGANTGIFYSLFLAKHFKSRFLYLSYMHSIIKNRKYICYIGIDPVGAIMADLANYNNIPLIYYNLELQTEWPGIGGFGFYVIKELEIIMHNKSIATIIQDEERAKVLFEYNKVSKDKQKILYLPVSMLGSSFNERTDFFYKTLGIPKDKKIFLQLGMIGSERMSVEIAKSAHDWPEDWILVMHGTFCKDVKRQIRKLNKKGNIFLSEKRVSFDDIPKIVASAHIGLVFYRQNRNHHNYYNNYYIGSSSGQLAHHLQCGIPIITINFPSLKRVVDEFQCGLAVDNPELIAESAKVIFDKYEFFRENAFKCFEEKYRFEKYFENISGFIKSLT